MSLPEQYYETEPVCRTIGELIQDEAVQANIKQTKSKEDEKTKESVSTTRRKKRYGQTGKPFVHIPLDHIIIDELYLVLQITNVLTSNLIEEVMERDGKKSFKGNI